MVNTEHCLNLSRMQIQCVSHCERPTGGVVVCQQFSASICQHTRVLMLGVVELGLTTFCINRGWTFGISRIVKHLAPCNYQVC
jgi:hypothetical protein